MLESIIIKKGSDVELYIESLAFGGMGVAHLNKIVIFVKNTLPGQIVIARITNKRSSFFEARMLKVVEESPYYQDAKCIHFSDCGGCSFQNFEYKQQLYAKELQLKDVFRKIGGFKELDCLEIVQCDEIFHYRNKMEFTFSNQEYLPELHKDRKAKKKCVRSTRTWKMG